MSLPRPALGCGNCPGAGDARPTQWTPQPWALVASHHHDVTAVARETSTAVLGLLDEHRDNLTRQRVRVVNQLHALLLEMYPGGLRAQMTATRAQTLVDTIEGHRSSLQHPARIGPRTG
jgi:hypothetical protein